MVQYVADNKPYSLQKHRYIRANVFQDLLGEIIRGCPNGQDAIYGLGLKAATCSSNQTLKADVDETKNKHPEDQNDSEVRIGGLTESDISRFAGPIANELDISIQSRLAEELDSRILLLSEFFHGKATSDLSASDRLERACNIPNDIQVYFDELASDKQELATRRHQIQKLVAEINDIHPRLQDKLVHLLSTFPPILNGERSASNDLLATTIETSLIKLALIRARAHQSLYNHKSPNNPQVTMTQALTTLYEKMKKDEYKIEEEQSALDRQIDEYQQLLQFVDGTGGGFKQVVEDWIRVRKEKEECKRDLRRLGWTED